MKPVIVLAFANDRDEHLRWIKRERINIYRALQDLHDIGLVQVHKEENTSVEGIFRLFKRYHNSIIIFHYGGHAKGTHLQLETIEGESQKAYAPGLAQLMGNETQLQLVFLNGCATLGQVEFLLASGVRAVIATSVPINDMTATEFAEQFYEKLADEATIKEAFEFAKAFITTRYGPSREINIYSDLSWRGKKKAWDKEVPWGLYINEQSPEVLDWKLPWKLPPTDPNEKIPEDMPKDIEKIPIEDESDITIKPPENLDKNTSQPDSNGNGIHIEIREVTVISGKISGHKQMLEKLGRKETHSTMKNCFKMFGSVIENFYGSMESSKIIGSSFTAFFGLPAAIDDPPKKAVRAAIEILDKLSRWRQDQGLQTPLDIRFGIETGEVTVDLSADMEFRHVIGDPENIASRLRELAGNGEIYVGPSTHRYTCNEFNYEQLKPIKLEGRKEPFPVFKFLSPKKETKQTDREIHSDIMVGKGRDKELDKLKLQVLKVINGEGWIVSVIGEAGIGKSRLIDELKKFDDLKKVILLEGRALSHGRNFSYFPIIDILKNWAEIKEEDSETSSFNKLEKAITHIYTGGGEEVLPFVATLMGMKLRGKYARRVKGIEGDKMENVILKNMRELIKKIAEHRSLVFIIHDIHWADLSSIELLESLFRLAVKHSILFIIELRPNHKETGERVLRTIRERYGPIYLEIKLEPLDEKDCEELIKNLLKGSELPIGISNTIANRAGGNPFFIEEVLRSFIDSGVIVVEDGKFKVTGEPNQNRIPGTIPELLMARIEGLDPATRTLLRVASVIGRYFFYKILNEVAKTVGHIDDKLEYLKEMQILRVRTRLGEKEYFFKHALTQEVIYGSILPEDRKELHLKVAAAVESVFSEKLNEFYGMLALHYSRGENLDKAEEYLIKAGEEALKAAASWEALHYYKEALKIYRRKSGDGADPEKIAMLEKNIALAYYNKGHMVEAVQYFDKVFAYWGEKRPKNKFTALLNLLVNLLIGIKIFFSPYKKAKKIPGDRDYEIIELAEKKVMALSFIDTKRTFTDIIGSVRWLKKFDLTKKGKLTIIYSGISAIFSITGISFKISGKVLDYAKNSINKTKDDKPLLVYNMSKLFHNAFAGNWDKECECDENLIDRNLDIGEVLIPSVFLGYSTIIKIVQGNFGHASILLKKLDEIGEDYDNDYARQTKYTLNALLLWQHQKLTDALDEIDEGLSIANRAGHNMSTVFISGIKSYIQILQEATKEAEDSLSKARELASHEKWIIPVYIGPVLVSQFLYDLYMLEEAIHSKNRSEVTQFRNQAYNNGKIAVKNSMKVVPLKLFTFKLMGVYYWLSGKQKKALEWWGKSIRMGEKLGARPELARTYMEVGKRLLETNSKFHQLEGIPAEEYLEKAHALFKEMELERDLEELDKIKSQIEKGE